MTRPQILFVDDDPSVLSALRRMLTRRHDGWDLHWATTATQALGYFARDDIDVLITDMQMPGIDGADLLDRVRRLYPGTARLVLSGHADLDAIVATAGPTQQFLSKPCDPILLEAALTAAVAAQQLMDDPGLKSLIGGQTALPKPTALFTELTALIARPAVTVIEIARLIERDVAMTAEILKLVNSSFFGLAGDVTTIERAVTLLGLDVIQALVLAGNVFKPGAPLPAGLQAPTLADRGLRACLAARRIGQSEGWERPLINQLGLAALLHDVGLLVLAAGNPTAWHAYQDSDPATAQRARETDAFGCTIGRASAYLLGLWGFARIVVTTLAEQPLDLDDATSRATASPAALAVAFAHHLATDPDHVPRPGDLHDYLDQHRVEAWTG